MYNNLIKEYISKVTKNMGSNQRKEVAKELETHILDSAEALATLKNVDTDETIIREVIARMGSPKEVAAMYPTEKTSSDKVVDILKDMGKVTLHFIIIVAVIWIVIFVAFWIYFGSMEYIEFNMFTLFVIILIYIVILAFHLIKRLRIFLHN